MEIGFLIIAFIPYEKIFFSSRTDAVKSTIFLDEIGSSFFNSSKISYPLKSGMAISRITFR